MKSLESAEASMVQLGFPVPTFIGSGMEGHVFRVADDSIAKVWHDKPKDDLIPLQQFYDVVLSLNLPFATPHITSIESIEDVTITIERALEGTSLQSLVDSDEAVVPPMALDAVISVLQALSDASLADVGHLPEIPVLGLTTDAVSEHQSANLRLLDIAGTKLAHSEPFLRSAVPEFETVKDRIFLHISRLPIGESRPVHGDICTPNVLLDSAGNVSALLDWGFVSFFGDPAFDASLAAGFYNMYGPHHRQLDDALLAACIDRLGHSRDRLLVYRSLYALLTSNAYAADGTDGHFDWCVEQLNRDDLRETLARQSVS